jgi:hypothetical protein
VRVEEGSPEAQTPERVLCFGEIELTEAEAQGLTDAAIVERLVETGHSRLTAARMVELGRGDAELGRARPHKTARR